MERTERKINRGAPLACVRIAFASLCLLPIIMRGAVFECPVTSKLESDGFVYGEERLQSMQASVVIHDGVQPALERCSYAPSQGRVTCDRYPVDHVAYDENVDLKKFYVFSSQFDVQLFSNLRFVENNGRGGISFGTCKLSTLE